MNFSVIEEESPQTAAPKRTAPQWLGIHQGCAIDRGAGEQRSAAAACRIRYAASFSI